jgi:hypothetical protein
VGSLVEEIDNMMTSEGLYKRQSDADMDHLARRVAPDPSHSEPHTADERDDDLMLGAHTVPPIATGAQFASHEHGVMGAMLQLLPSTAQTDFPTTCCASCVERRSLGVQAHLAIWRRVQA